MLARQKNSDSSRTALRSGAVRRDQALILAVLRRALRAVARVFVGLVAHDVAARVLMQEYVAAAHCKLIDNNERASQSRIGLLTGIGPEAIREQLNAPTTIIADRPMTIEDRIIKYWCSHRDFLNVDGKQPGRLLICGPGITFQGLINRITRGLTPKTALASLEARGAVKVVNCHWVELVTTTSTSCLSEDQRNNLQLLAKGVSAVVPDKDRP